MAKKIVRGMLIGGFLGIVFGLAGSYILFFIRTAGKDEETLARQIAGSPYISAMETDAYSGENEISLPEIMPDPCALGQDVNYQPPECDDLEDVILRFHVRANSNSAEDLALKYDVRDAVLMLIGEENSGDCSRDEILEYISEHVDEIRDTAAKVIEEAGYDYDVNVYIANDFFPIRQYGELVLPAGNYQALRIDIGAAEGENFWCILYPMMCYTIDSGAVVSREDEKKLEENLSEEDYRKLFVDCDTGDNEVVVRFKFVDWLKHITE
ncbi:MAG: stage II sporulation protein R [Wujia sp.]